MRFASPRLCAFALMIAPACTCFAQAVSTASEPAPQQSAPAPATPVEPTQIAPPAQVEPGQTTPAQAAPPQGTPTPPVATPPAQAAPVKTPPAVNEQGQPITDILTYTIDPVTGQRVPMSSAPPEPPPTKAERKAALAARHSFFDDRYHFGVMASIGTAGAGIQFGIPLVPHVALRVGGDYIRYTGKYQYDAANVGASLQFGYGRVALDYFPWRHRRFHLSPMLIVANQTHVQANVNFDQSTTFEIEGYTFYSSPSDPLHGVGRVDLRKTSPGLTVGFGNLTHGRGHWTFPVEMGFFYNDQPKLQIDFTGTACLANVPAQYAVPVQYTCMRVQDNTDFQTSVQAFRARQEHNLTYAHFIPVFNFGVGYRF